MTRRQLHQLKAVRGSHAVLLKHRAVWESFAGIAEQEGVANDLLLEISQLMVTQDEARKGLADAKRAAQAEVIRLLLKVTAPCAVWAHTCGKTEMRTRMDVTLTGLQTLHSRLPVQAAHLLAHARVCLAEGAGRFGLRPESLDALAAALDSLNRYDGAPRLAAAERKTATRGLAEALGQLLSHFADVLDPLVRQFQDEHPRFVGEYQNSRRIGQEPVRRAALADRDTEPDTAPVLQAASRPAVASADAEEPDEAEAEADTAAVQAEAAAIRGHAHAPVPLPFPGHAQGQTSNGHAPELTA